MEEMVNITAARFSALLRHDAELDVLTSCLMNHASLSWNEKALQFDSDAVSAVLKSMYPDAYKAVMSKLQKQKGE